jgi:hypothetical protein
MNAGSPDSFNYDRGDLHLYCDSVILGESTSLSSKSAIVSVRGAHIAQVLPRPALACIPACRGS